MVRSACLHAACIATIVAASLAVGAAQGLPFLVSTCVGFGGAAVFAVLRSLDCLITRCSRKHP